MPKSKYRISPSGRPMSDKGNGNGKGLGKGYKSVLLLAGKSGKKRKRLV